MPIYEYQCINQNESCKHCKNPFEVFQKIKDDPVEICPRCAAEVEKIVSRISKHNEKKDTKKLLSDDNLKKHGFHKIVNEGGGKFKKIV